MGPQDKTVEFLFNPTRWTFGVAWEYYRTKEYVVPGCNNLWRLEISIQFPVVAISILLGSKQLI